MDKELYEQVMNFKWDYIVPEKLPTLDLSGFATVAQVKEVEQSTTQSLKEQAAAIGSQIASEVGKEQLINAAISASVKDTATKLIELQTTAFGELSEKIAVVSKTVDSVDSKVGMVDSRVSTVDSRVTDAQKATEVQFAQTNDSVKSVVGTVAGVVSSVASVSASLDATNSNVAGVSATNDQQNVVLGELVKMGVNLKSVVGVILDSIPDTEEVMIAKKEAGQ